MGQVGNSDIEWVDVVDENNDVIGQSTRDQMRAENLRHRATYIVVHDGMGKILVQRRTQSKDFYPGLLDATAGGVVQQGENMLDSARREAEEELGIAGVPFAEHGVFYYEEPVCRVWGGLFSCVTHGPFALQECEVAQVIWLTPAEITARCDEFTPDSLKALSLWLTRNNQVSYIAGDRVKPVTPEPEATRDVVPEIPVETPAAEMSSENE
ncbi:NUDIX hydrolase YfcD [Morganella psychrotolerans]|uniref:NUDIX hydrolase YfcD n=1 Tax=Morganella psychrotolerans TaxID=368603 RepID=A0A5M9R890_9GAMM|nr:NUDIX hydrolase YfcD [Morganella psychrotolerans]KAA8716801.1 NUDIX hydrolase YfcD [Morganella psychrotolerans]